MWAWLGAVWQWFRLAWLHVVHLSARGMLPKARGSTVHRVLLLGDGLACGYGDWATLGQVPGLAKRLEQALADDARLRHRFLVLSCGVWRSTSLDWAQPCGSRDSLLTRVMSKDECTGAEIAVVLVGGSDHLCGDRRVSGDPGATVAHVQRLAQRLHDEWDVEHVIVATLPTHAPKHPASAVEVYRQRLLCEWLRNQGSEPLPAYVQPGPNLGEPRWQPPELWSFDGYHPCSSGYRAIAGALAPQVVNAALAVQWQATKAMFGARTHDTADEDDDEVWDDEHERVGDGGHGHNDDRDDEDE